MIRLIRLQALRRAALVVLVSLASSASFAAETEGVPELRPLETPVSGLPQAQAPLDEPSLRAAYPLGVPVEPQLGAEILAKAAQAAQTTQTASVAAKNPAQVAARAQEAVAVAPSSQRSSGLGARAISIARALWPSFGAKTDESVDAVEAPSAASAVRNNLVAKQVPITIKTKAGIDRPLAFDPKRGRDPLYKAIWRNVSHPIEKIRRIRQYLRRVNQLVDDVTDDDLRWSLQRLDELKSQEGILRTNNRELVNKWKNASNNIRRLSPADFAESSLDEESLIRPFKEGMDKEEPTLQFQFTSAHNIHNHMPRVSHFMGWTQQEYILAVALKGKQGEKSIWSMEEVRHGPILERVYNMVRNPNRPPLVQQGIASKQPEAGEYSARSMMSNRALAEWAAGSAYLIIKANAKKDSPTDKVLEGIYRDEVYHYVIMSAVNKLVYGHRSRWSRLRAIIKHSFDFPTPTANDRVVYDRKFPSPLLAFEILYAFNAIDKRVDRYLKTLPDSLIMDWVGPVYPTDKDVSDAIARGVHTWTPVQYSEQNPELMHDEVAALEQRFPGRYFLSRRKIEESFIQKTIDEYRDRSLTNAGYWKRKKGMTDVPGEPGVIARALEKTPGASLRVRFSPVDAVIASDVEISIVKNGETLFSSKLGRMSMLQIGAILDADSDAVVAELAKPEVQSGLSAAEIVKRLNNSGAYQKKPLDVVPDGPRR